MSFNVETTVASAMAICCLAFAARAQSLPPKASLNAWTPSGVIAQFGTSRGSNAVTTGAIWNWDWQLQNSLGMFTGYWAGTLSGWRSKGHDPHDHWSAQIGVAPVFRLYPKWGGAGWFVEAGIGANLITPVYRARGRRFSTAFNFSEQIGIGRRFGECRRHEVALQFQHFSNAGIREPNPGENFVQLRYMRYF